MISLEKRTLLSLKKAHQVGEDDVRRSKEPITSKLCCRTNASIITLYPHSQISENRSRCQILKSDHILFGAWRNIYISTAIPLLLQVERMRNRSNFDVCEIIEARVAITKKIYHIKHQLAKQGHLLEEIEHLSYLLCTYIDDINITKGLAEEEPFHISLLMEFHKEIWGGTNCFTHLNKYLSQAPQKRNILEFYYLIISLGFEGKYKILDQGPTLLMELRSHLNTLLYDQDPIRKLTDISLNSTPTHSCLIKKLKRRLMNVIVFLLFFGVLSWYLYQSNCQIDSDTLTWSGYLDVIEYTDTIPLKVPSLNQTLRVSEKRSIAIADKLKTSTSINQTHNREIIAIEQGESEPISDNTARNNNLLY